MRGSRPQSSNTGLTPRQNSPGLSTNRGLIYLKTFTVLILILTSTLNAAFEGAEYFRTVFTGVDGILPVSMNCPAQLPDQDVWLSIGHGQPLGYAWAAYSTIGVGGSTGRWRGATGAWFSGDKLYRETSLSAALSRDLHNRLTVGLSLAYHDIDISGYDTITGELLFGGAVKTELTDRMDVTIWYNGQTLTRDRAYGSLARQLYQLAVSSRIGENNVLVFAIEKTPPFVLRHLVEIDLLVWQELTLLAGYRTAPALLYAGIQVPYRRINLSIRASAHPIFGISTAFGLSFR